ncbi:hypothetical protein CK203_116150 [Vitis vinifera]|uniref:Uncharacterized protein n=1 Tax=Vitis vinifera TaxID=29760 RepID=A0A438DDK7_VITVI|nr:hypothetical protein CK203_116150 [Vitis vinifera]
MLDELASTLASIKEFMQDSSCISDNTNSSSWDFTWYSIPSGRSDYRMEDLKSLVHATFNVEEAIARGLWTNTAHSPDSKGKRPVGSSSRSGEPYIAQTSMQPRPPHPRATTHPPPRPYAQRPVRQFTPLGMTLTRAFEKLRDAGLTVPLALRPLPHPIPLHFRSQALLTSSDSGA